MTYIPIKCDFIWKCNNILLWSFIAGKLGVDSALSRPFLMAIRGMKINSLETHQPIHKPSYDDTYVLLSKGEIPIVFPGSTSAYQKNSKLSPDTVKDGLGDVGSIRAGTYTITDTGSKPYPIFTVKFRGSDRIPCHRDFDHDGVISEEEYKNNLQM